MAIADHHNANTSPLDSIPDEVLDLVFHKAINISPMILHASKMPYIISRVCKRWRNLSLESKLLWRYFVFYPSQKGNQHTPLLSLERSGGVFLVVSINYPKLVATDVIDALTDNITLCLLPYMTSVASLHIIFDRLDLVPRILRLFFEHDSLKSLEYLHLESTGVSPGFIVKHIDCDATKRNDMLESIRVLHLCGIHTDWTRGAHKNLVEFELGNTIGLRIEDVAKILRANPSLRFVNLHGHYFAPSAGTIDRIQLSDLRSFKVAALRPSEELERLLLALSWPPSNQLDLCIDNLELSEKDWLRFPRWEAPPSSTFRLGEKLSPPVLRKLLPMLRSVDTLLYYNGYLDDSVAELLTEHQSNSDDGNYPQFQTIELRVCRIIGQDPLQTLVLAHNVRRLRLIQCTVLHEYKVLPAWRSYKLVNKDMGISSWLEKVVADFEICNEGMSSSLYTGSQM
ncbi:F-box-like protein [Ceratobasidium sp. AG-Ba]|nr:F-box-like protein [Ceratobasidium sp. AG-Ba]QRW04684.1 F-box-like protein [Ceratobasidium sp. AG-Ba]